MEFIRALGRECSDNYPETLHLCLISPAGFALRALWAVASVFFDKKTRNKVWMLADWKQWLTYIDRDQLPVAYGGTHPFVWTPELLMPPGTLGAPDYVAPAPAPPPTTTTPASTTSDTSTEVAAAVPESSHAAPAPASDDVKVASTASGSSSSAIASETATIDSTPAPAPATATPSSS